MPKIPMVNKPGMIQHQRSTVLMTGAPGMNFKMDESRTLMNLGSEISNASAKIGDAVNRAVSAREQFFLKQQDTENKLAATEARNLYRTINTELENRMAGNPAEFEKFKDWAAEADKSYADGVLDFTKKMSPEFRQQFESEMNGVRTENLMRRERIGIQAKVTANYNLFQSQWKDAALRGDLTACNRMLEEHNGLLISQQEYEQKKLDYGRLAAFGEAKRMVEAGTPGITGKLKERNSEGHYANFTGLDDAARDRFIRVAEANDAQKRSDENQTLVDRLNSGEQITAEDIDRFFEGQTAPEAVKQKNQQRQIVQHFINAQNTAKRQKERLEKLRNDDAQKKQVDAHEYQLLSFEFSSDPAVRQKQYADMRNEILTRYAGDGPAVKRLTTQLNETFKAKIKPDSSYKSTFIYKNAMEVLGTMKKDFDCYKKPGGWKYTKDDAVKASNYEMMKVKLDEFIRVNPSATADDARAFIEQTKQYINNQAQQDLLSAWGNLRIPDAGNNLASGEMERMVNDRIAIFGTDKKFIRWKDGK